MGVGMPIAIGIAIAIAEFGTRQPVAIEAPKSSKAVRNRVVAKQELPPKPAEVPPEPGNQPGEAAPVIVPLPVAGAPPEPGPLQLQGQQANIAKADDQKRLNVRRGLGVARSTAIDDLRGQDRLQFRLDSDLGSDCFTASFRDGFVQLNGPAHDLDGISIGFPPDQPNAGITRASVIVLKTQLIVAPDWDVGDFVRAYEKATKEIAAGRIETSFAHDQVRVRVALLNLPGEGKTLLVRFEPAVR